MLSSGSKRLLSILLSLLISLSSLTFGADLHYCQGQLISIGLLGKARSCHQTGSDVCCQSSGKCCKGQAPVAEEIHKEKCCHNKLVVVEGIDHEKLRARAGLSFSPGAQAILIKVSTENVPGPIRVDHCYLPLSAWDQLQDLNVLYQRFLI